MRGGEKFPHTKSEEPLKDDEKIIGRRDFIKMGAALAGAAAVAGPVALGVERVGTYFKRASEERSERLGYACDYLQGNSSERRTFMGRELTYREFIRLLGELVDPPARRSELKAVLDSFTYMLKVEDSFGSPYNTLSILEELQVLREKHIQPHLSKIGVNKRALTVASSFGFGQIQPRTAVAVALERSDVLTRYGLLTNEQIAQLRQQNLDNHQIVKILDLRGDGNMLISYLYFFDCVNLYSRSTGGGVHGGLHLPERRGSLQPIRTANPRGFTLAVAAYSAGLDAPMAAKVQTYINELVAAYPTLRKNGTLSKPLNIDGDIGPGTLRAMQEVSKAFNFDVPEKSIRRNLGALDEWLLNARQYWRAGMDRFLLSDEARKPRAIRQMTNDRYSLQIKNYLLLKKYIGEAKARALLMSFVENRDPAFLDVIDKSDRYKEMSGKDQASYNRYVNELAGGIGDRIQFDEQYKGYIATHFKLPRMPLGDPMNIPGRIILAFDLDPTAPSRIQ